VSVEQQQEQEQQNIGFDDYIHNLNLLVDESLPLPHDPAAPDFLQDPPPGPLDAFAFADGAFDASFNAPLDFSFDDLINDSATVAVDGGAGAA